MELTDTNSTLLFPRYNAQLNMQEGKNEIFLIPDRDFDLLPQTVHLRLCKVVDDIGKIEIEAIKKEVEQFVPQKQNL